MTETAAYDEMNRAYDDVVLKGNVVEIVGTQATVDSSTAIDQALGQHTSNMWFLCEELKNPNPNESISHYPNIYELDQLKANFLDAARADLGFE